MSLTTPPNPQIKETGYVCEKGHVIFLQKHHKYSGIVCAICSNRKVLEGFNDLKSRSPELYKEWHPIKNLPLTAETVMYRSTKRVWWLCEKGHEWEGKVADRFQSKGRCPVCINQKVLAGFNDLATTHPELAKQWHPTKNRGSLATQVTAGSSKKIWWVCETGHEWETTIEKRALRSYGCPVCSNQKLLKGFNDLATTAPHLAAEWHPTKNDHLSPTQVINGSNKKVWWQCSLGHEWETTVNKRIFAKRNCPYCVNQRVLIGYNDLLSQTPELAEQWHPTKNKDLTPEQVVSGSNKYVWWQCSLGHEWETMPRERLRYGCPKCPTRSSKPEKDITNYLQELSPGLHIENNVRKVVKGYELDIYVPSHKIAVEYNGLYWHTEDKGRDKLYHYNKWVACKEQGIQLIQVWADEWGHNPDLVKLMVAHKMGLSPLPKIYARNTIAKTVDKDTAHKFLDSNHIQGAVRGSHYVGLFTKTENVLVAVMVVKKELAHSSVLSLTRFATAQSVVGGFTKLLKYVERTYAPDNIVTFSDNCVSDGELYEKNGFEESGVIAPDYKYFYKNQRVHKFNFRLKRFRNDPELQYTEGLTEKELATLNKIYRIWDAGKVKWVKKTLPQ